MQNEKCDTVLQIKEILKKITSKSLVSRYFLVPSRFVEVIENRL